MGITFRSSVWRILTIGGIKHFRIPLQLILHGPSMFTVRANIYGVLYNQASSVAFDETSSYWSALKRS